MQITIQTISGTYVVPPEKEAALVHWLQNNAIKVGSQPVAETMKNPFLCWTSAFVRTRL